MFPLSGGVVRFPHMSFGTFASYTSGWITWVAVATTAPIEVEAALQYGTKYAAVHRRAHRRRRHRPHPDRPRLRRRRGPDGGLRGDQLLRHPLVRPDQQRAGRLEARHHPAGRSSAFLVSAFHGANFTSHGFKPDGVARRLHRDRHLRDRLLLPRASGRAIELAGETDNPRRNVPLAVIGSVRDHRGHLHRPAGRVHRLARPRRCSATVRQLGQAELRERLRPAGRDRHRARPRLAGRAALRRRGRSRPATPA